MTAVLGMSAAVMEIWSHVLSKSICEENGCIFHGSCQIANARRWVTIRNGFLIQSPLFTKLTQVVSVVFRDLVQRRRLWAVWWPNDSLNCHVIKLVISYSGAGWQAFENAGDSVFVMWCVTFLVARGSFGRVWYSWGYLSRIYWKWGSIVCFTMTGYNLQPEKEIIQTNTSVFLSTSRRLHVTMCKIWCCRFIPKIGTGTSAVTKIQWIGLRKSILKHTYRLPYAVIGCLFTDCKLKTASFSRSLELAGCTSVDEVESFHHHISDA